MIAKYQASASSYDAIEFDIFDEWENGVVLYRGNTKDPSNQVAYLPFDKLSYISPSEE